MTAPLVDYKIHWLKMMSVPESRAVVGRHDGINGRDTAFIVYLIGHNRPVAELLAPTRRDLAEEFNRGLAGMTEGPVALDDLVGSREALIANAVGRMPEAHRRFLLSFEVGAPNWSLLGGDAAGRAVADGESRASRPAVAFAAGGRAGDGLGRIRERSVRHAPGSKLPFQILPQPCINEHQLQL